MLKLMDAIGKNMRSIIAIIVVLLGMGFGYAVLFKKIPPENKEAVYTAVGFMLGLVTGVITYYFGTSKDKSDAEKADITAKQTDAAK